MCSRTVLSLLDHEVGFGDALLIDPLTEDNFIQNLCQRFKRDQIYTYIGNMVVSINPYKPLAIYTPEVTEAYQKHNMYQLPPHIYAVADNAYQSMKAKNQDQCLIISGESGSGKTEAGKFILQYIVTDLRDTVNSIRNQLLQSNVILEAFGNAKTQRNENASRFGKYIDIEFDFKGDPEGGVISNYLLEKSRVTSQCVGERNFHIFYQLLSGAEVHLLKSLKLQRNVDNYNFLKSRSLHNEMLDDKNMFYSTKRALEIFGFTSEEFLSVFQLVAVVLKLGNVEFLPNANMDGTEGCICTNEYEIEDVCDLLKCQVSSLQTVLMQKMVEARLELVLTDLTASEAAFSRDSLCKAIYSRLFTWIVQRINESIKQKKHGRRRALGVLDIYGFEVFENNGFEQLIINYCNEKLQQIFIEQTLKNEQEEYLKEGIQWTMVEFNNNFNVCDLLERNSRGILSVLDDECGRLCHASDETFLRRLDQVCIGHPSYIGGARRTSNTNTGCRQSRRRSSIKCNTNGEHASNQDQNQTEDQTDHLCGDSGHLLDGQQQAPENCFGIRHYAGTVIYNVSGFLDKNNDLISKDLSRAMYQCEHVLMKILFSEGNPKRTTLKRPTTATTQFKIAINALMKNLESKTPSYVRCIKPNELKQPLIFEMALVQHQIRYLGLLETVRLQRVGFSFHQTYEQFLFRYKMLSLNTWPSWKGLPSEGVGCLLRDLPIPPAEYAFGRMKIFIRSTTTVFDLEEFRRLRLDELASLIQRTYRGWRQRSRYMQLKASQTKIAALWKGYKLRKSLLSCTETVYTRVNHPIIECALRTVDAADETRETFNDFRLSRLTQWAALVIQRAYGHYKKKQYLIFLSKNLPSMSPTCRSWVLCRPELQETSRLLWRLYHKWRCHKYRHKFDQTARNRMREKVTSSIIFRGKKASYPRSVSHPFHGDYVRLRHNSQWKKLCSETDHYVVFADIVNKVTRSAGKCVPVLFVLSTSSMLILDHRTMQIKYRVPVSDIYRLSLSPHWDDVAVFHVRTSEMTKRKGDFVFQTCHVIEIVTKVFLVVQNATGKPPEVNVLPEFQAVFGNQIVTFVFKSTGLPEVQPGQVKIVRKAARMEVIL